MFSHILRLQSFSFTSLFNYLFNPLITTSSNSSNNISSQTSSTTSSTTSNQTFSNAEEGISNTDGTYTIYGITFESKADYQQWVIQGGEGYGIDTDGIMKAMPDLEVEKQKTK